MFARKMNHNCLINIGGAVHLATFELPDTCSEIATSWNNSLLITLIIDTVSLNDLK